MIIMEIKGGLGNQMFQYALGYKLTLMGKKVKYDISSYVQNRRGNNLRKFELDLFELEMPIAAERELIQMGSGVSILGKICKRSGLGKNKIYTENLDEGYQPSIFMMDDIYMSGYWQSEKYFKDIRTQILDIYRMPPSMERENRAVLEEIGKTNSVSMHIRRGDYLNEQNRDIYGGICTSEYYESALNVLHQRMGNIKVFLFTDDPGWAKKKFKKDDVYVVEENFNTNNAYDLFLMSRCRANIIANSSFSWWGAWLNQNREKVVIAPSKWFNNHNTSDYVCENWITI